jgi:large subunit ribosomal protein L21
MSDAVKGSTQYAVIETGGKQYRVSEGDHITVERLAAEQGSEITIDRVLLIGGDGSTRIGTPVVEGASVSATIDEHKRGEKLYIFKYKALPPQDRSPPGTHPADHHRHHRLVDSAVTAARERTQHHGSQEGYGLDAQRSRFGVQTTWRQAR